MPRPPSRLASISVSTFLLLLSFASASASANPTAPLLLRPPHDYSRPAFLFPLHLSSPNSSSSSSSNPRRLLQRSESKKPNARMRLYDDLLLNGYYTTRLLIGTPPQKFALIVDTGSSVTYVPCSTCDQCGNHQDPRFDPDQSSTYQAVKCNIDCTCDNERVQCLYERQYAEMSTSSGVLGEDLLSFGNLSELAPQRAVFGCENMETGDLYSQHADGIMGLGRGELSVVDQLVDKGVINDSFSLCYGGMDIGGGAMVLGGISPPNGMVFAKSDPVRSPYYNVDLKGIHIGGKQLSINPMIFDEKHGSVLDSGTTYAYLPEAAFVAFKDAIMKELKSFRQIRGPDPNYNDVCFAGFERDVSQLANSFPAVDMVFGNGQKLSLSPENYLFRHSKVRGAYCLGIFQNGKDPTTLLGGIVVRNTLVTYDRENSKIGFWKTNCSELWERLRTSDSPPPISPAPSENNLTTRAPSTFAPNETFEYVLQEYPQIGRIMFNMSFNISSTELKPQITLLAEDIASEFNINVSQVHLLNFTSIGNDSLVTLAIIPAGSADFISNTTAESIISRLEEHDVQLPDTFANYELVGWNVEPKAKRTSWQQQYLAVTLALFVSLIIGFSAFGVWFIWRRRKQSINSYKPVNVANPEQELQPL